MRKSLFLLALCSVVASMTVSVAAEEPTANAPEATIKPVIDGVIDPVWENADKMYGDQYGGDLLNDRIVSSYASLMWDADGLYLLGVMYDTTLTDAAVADAADPSCNSIDFWVSETYTEDTTFDGADGDWHYCKSSAGAEPYYTGNETVYNEATTAVEIYDEFYVVEIFCPWQTVGYAPEVGGYLGFNVSFNDDADVDGERDMYSYWATTEYSGSYWSETIALPKIYFTEGPVVEVDAGEVDAGEVGDEVVDVPVDTTPATADAGIVAAAAIMAVAAGVVLSKKH